MARDNGGIIGPANDPTSTTASGVWDLPAQYQAISGGNWPPIPSIAANSLRFNSGSSDYLSKTFSAGNQKTWTWSFWTKIPNYDASNNKVIFSGYNDASNSLKIQFANSDQFQAYGLSGGSLVCRILTNQLFRDYSAWYHIVYSLDTTQATSTNRQKLWVNGEEVTSFSTRTDPSLNADLQINNAIEHQIGAQNNGEHYSNYMSEVIFIDGQQLDPTSFGQFNANGVWTPIPIGNLTYGTNGFRLKFENSASLGLDSSPNGNNFTVNNLTSIDQVTDTPTNNFATLNPLNNVGTGANPIYSEGNLKVISSADNYFGGSGSIGVTTGKWYLEIELDAQSSSGQGVIGMSTNIFEEARQNRHVGQLTNFPSVGYYGSNGNKVIDGGTDSAYGNSYTAGDIIGIAIDLENNYIYFAKNGTWQNSGVPTSGATGTGAISLTSTTREWFLSLGDGGSTSTATYLCNFGNPPFTISSGNSDANGYGNFEYAVPSGYYALNTKNLAQYG